MSAADRHTAQHHATTLQQCKSWPWFRSGVMSEIDNLRDSLERDQTETKTAETRGRIAALRGLIQRIETTMPPSKIQPGAHHE